MSIEMEGLEFQIEAKSDSALKGIDALASSFTRLKKALDGKGLDGLSTKLEAISTAVSDAGIGRLEGLSRALGTLGAVKISSTVPKRMTEISAALDGLTQEKIERVGALSTALQGMESVKLPELPKVAQSAGVKASPVSRKATSSGLSRSVSEVGKVTPEVNNATTAVQRFTSVLRNAGGVFSKVFSAAGGVALKTLGSGLNKLTSSAKVAISSGKLLGSTFGSRMAAQVKRTNSSFGQLFSSMKRIAMYRLIRFVFAELAKMMKEGINNLYQYSSLMGTTFSSSLDRCATSFQYLKNSVGAVAAPIITVLAPALDFVIDKIVTLLNLINQFFAVLSGASSYTVAKKAATSYGESAKDAADATKKAAKEIKDALVGIDELNIISPKDESNGGGAGTDYGSMFEEVPIDSSFEKIKDTLSQLFQPLKDAWDTYGQGVMDAFHRALQSIKDLLLDIGRTWKEVWLNGSGYELISNILLLLQSVLNWIADIADAFRKAWEVEGTAVVQAMLDAWNSVLSLLVTISETFRAVWNDGTGVEIATLLLQIWTNIHLIISQIADTIKAVWENGSGLELAQNIFAVIKEILIWIKDIQVAWMAAWDTKGLTLVQSVFDLLNSILGLIVDISQSFRTAFEGGSGVEILEHCFQIVTDLCDTVANLASRFREAWNEAGTGDAIAQTLLDIFNVILGTIEKITTSTSEWAAHLDFSPLLTSVKGLLESIEPVVQKIGDALAWVWEDILLPLGTWAVEGALPAAIDALAAAFDALNAILEVLKPVGTWLWDNFLKPIATWTGGAIVEILEMIAGLFEKLADVLGRLSDVVKGNTSFTDFIDTLTPGEAILLGIATAVGAVTAAIIAYNIAGPIATAVTTALGVAIGILTSPITLVIGVITALVAGFVLLYQHFEPFRDFIDGIAKAAENLLPGIIEGIKKGWDAFWGFLDGIWEGIVNGFKDFFGINSPSRLFAELGGFLIAGLHDGISNHWKDIIDFFTTKPREIKEALSQKWSEIKQDASEKWGSIKETLGTAWGEIKTSAQEKFDEVREKIEEAWNKVKTTADEKWASIKETLGTTWTTIKDSAQEKFDEVREKVSDSWEKIKSTTGETWDFIKETLTTTWGTIKTTAQEKFDEVREKVGDAWDKIKTTTSETWDFIKETLGTTWTSLKDSAREKFDEIKQKIGDAWEGIKTEASDKWEGITSTIKEKWNGLVSSAQSWGSDLCRNISSGIQSGISWVTNAVSGVAGKINSYLHFTEPDVGPLSNFHTYMPDMLKLMATGINDNAYLAENAVYDLADSVSRAFNSVSPDDLELPTERALSVRYAVDTSRDLQGESGGRDFGKVEVNNAEVVNALYSVAEQIVNAIDEKDMSVNIDGKQMMRSVEKAKRQRGADILSGGVMP